jgi:outer membrane protein assembly factor BamD (BamD/ComL family)
MKALCMTMMVLMVLITGCVSGETKAAELLDTAKFEEKQTNLEHATKLYEEILRKYPTSPAAKEAAARMAELTQKKP